MIRAAPVLPARSRLTVLVALIVLLTLACTAAARAAAAPMVLEHARFIPGDALHPPASGGTPIMLPDSWRITHPDLSGYAWYVMHFRLDTVAEQPLVLYVPHVSLIGEFWLNGSLLNGGVQFDSQREKGTMMSDAPVRLVLPSGLFKTGDNVLAVKVQGSTQIRSGLSAATLGTVAQIEPAWRLRYTLQVAVPYAIVVVLVAGLCFLVAHLRRQRRTHMLQFGMLVGVVAASSYLSANLPISRGELELVRIFSSTTMYWVLFMAGYQLAGIRVRWLLPAWHALTLGTLVAVGIAAVEQAVTDQLWLLLWPHIAARFAVVGLVLYRGWRDRSVKHLALGFTALLWVLCIVQSNLILMDLLPWDDFRWSVAGGAPFCVALLFVFAETFILDREQAAVAQRTAITTERGRILQDMHDGMGAHLITALHMARRPETDKQDMVRSLEESIQDMRLIIDSLDMQSSDLLPLLANLRFRMEPRLKAIGIRLEWDVQPLPVAPDLSPEEALAVLRIVQEAVNNAIRHALPTAICIAVWPEEDAAMLAVTNDGRGFTIADADRPGAHGLKGMRARAAKLGATLTIDSGTAGTQVRLRMQRDPGRYNSPVLS